MTRQFGETHHDAKLTESQVVEARRRYADGESQAALAREYGVTQSVMHKAIRGHTWAHIQATATTEEKKS